MNFELIDNKRKQLRYTVTAFCEEVGIDRTTYYLIQKDPESIRVSTLNKMADVLNLTKAERKQLIT